MAGSQQRLAACRNQHAGKRCFIMAMDPACARQTLKIAREMTFGLNRIYLAFPELGSTTYLVAVNDLVLEQWQPISALTMPKYITWRARRDVRRSLTTFLDTDFTGEENFQPRCHAECMRVYRNLCCAAAGVSYGLRK